MIQRLKPKRYTGQIKTAILDWSGTTADIHVIAPAVVFVEVFQKHGVNISMKEARGPMGLRKDLHIAEILKIPEVKDRWTQIKGKQPSQEDVDAMFKDFVPMQVGCLSKYTGLIEGTVDAVKKLKQMGIGIGTTTGFTKVMTEVLLRDAEKQGYMPDSCVAGDQVQNNLGFRPLPFMVYQNMVNLKAWPIQSVVKVDDTVSGVGEGLNAGCWSVGVYKYSNYTDVDSVEQWEQMNEKEKNQRILQSKEKLLTSGAHYVIETINELPQVVEDINTRLKNGESP